MSKLCIPLASAALAAVAFPLGAQVVPAGRAASAPPALISHKLAGAPKAANTIEAFMSPSSPLEVSAARKADKIAWVAYERGMRNVYVASAPDFKATKVTKFNEDDGVDVGSVRLSDDGSIVTFVRGSGQNRAGWVANPSHDPNGGDRAVWAAHTDGSGAWRLADITTEPGVGGGRGGGGPELSPDGRYVVFPKDGQLYRARTARGATTAVDTGGVAVHQGVGTPEQSAVVARRIEARVREHARQPRLHRRVRYENSQGRLPCAECRLRRQPDVVA